MKAVKIIVGGVVALAIVTGAATMVYKNRLVASNEAIKAAWSQLENVTQRRADLIPNLVAIVKGYAKQEKEIFIKVAEARAKMAGARTVPEKIGANEQMDSALARLMIVVEQYPQLKSNQNFQQLQDELAGTENRIAVERMRYNETVQAYNLLVKGFPGALFASFYKYEPNDSYFKAAPEAHTPPKVAF